MAKLKRHKKHKRESHEKRRSLAISPARTDEGTTADKKGSSLLFPPPELRNIIYDYAFAGSILMMRTETKKEYATDRPQHQFINLLVCCKQIHTEAVDVFYSNLTIQTPFLSMFKDYALKLPAKHVHRIKQIRFLILEAECSLARNGIRFDIGAAKKAFQCAVAGFARKGIAMEPGQLLMEYRSLSGAKVLEYFHGGYKRY